MRYLSGRCKLAAAFLAAVLAAPWTAAAAATVRCLTPDDRIVYQDTRCPEGSRASPVDDTPNQGFRFPQEHEIQRLKDQPVEALPEPPPPPRAVGRARPKHRYNAEERQRIASGMKVAEVRRRIGAPDQIVRLNVPSATGIPPKRDPRRRWIYLPAAEDAETTTTLTVLRGLVLHVERTATR